MHQMWMTGPSGRLTMSSTSDTSTQLAYVSESNFRRLFAETERLRAQVQELRLDLNATQAKIAAWIALD